MRKKITIRVPRTQNPPPLGFNPAAKTGNASGVHPPEKGKGSEYSRSREKDRDRKENDDGSA